MSTKENEAERAYDIRILERNIRKGLITRKDVEKYLKSLPDRADNVERMAVEEAPEKAGASGSNGVSGH